MFCFKCGKQIKGDSVFCKYCGAKQNEATSIVDTNVSASVPSQNSAELDRVAIKIYLSNVLSLECIKANYKRKISNLDCEILEHSNNDYVKRYKIRGKKETANERYAYFLYNGYVYFKRKSDGTPWHYSSVDSDDTGWGCIRKDSDLDYLGKAGECWRSYEDRASLGFFEKLDQRAEARDAFFKAYEDFKATAPTIYQWNAETNKRKIDSCSSQINGMSEELDAIDNLLKQAYDVNIIPSQFRNNIHAIYFLLDFMSTSRETFTTALLHLDLDQLKDKLDKTIAQQESIIIQNAVMVAQNEKLSEQNQMQLEHLSKIENNTRQAAQYSQIAASNAETCAWFSAANYIEL